MDAFFTSGDTAVIIAALVGFVSVVLGLAVPVILTLRRAHTTGQEVTQMAAEARDNSNAARGAANAAATTAGAVQAQVLPNGGSSLRDVADRLEQGQREFRVLVDRLATTADRVDQRTLILDQRLTAIERKVSPT